VHFQFSTCGAYSTAESQREERESQAQRAEEEDNAGGDAPTNIRTDPSAPPNEILFVQGLPGEWGSRCAAWKLYKTTPLPRKKTHKANAHACSREITPMSPRNLFCFVLFLFPSNLFSATAAAVQ
jgi:hypothetical protein